ncbi:MAG: hypothetical protein R3Y58_06495 [Eubacteriales bacterium]
MNNDWMNNPALKNMDAAKIELLKTVASQTNGKAGNDLAPVLFSLITNAKKKHIQFSSDEFTLILQILKEGKSKEETAQIDKTVNMVRSLLKL